MSLDPIYQPFSTWLVPITFTGSGRPEMLSDEVELATCPKTNVYDGEVRLSSEQLCIITSKRLLYIHSTDRSRSFSCPLINLRSVSYEAKWFKTPKLLFQFRHIDGDAQITSPTQIDASFASNLETQPRKELVIGSKEDKQLKDLMTQFGIAQFALISAWKSDLTVKLAFSGGSSINPVISQPSQQTQSNFQQPQQQLYSPYNQNQQPQQQPYSPYNLYNQCQQPQPAIAEPDTSARGVRAVIARKQQEDQFTKQQMSTALDDLDSLMKHAQTVTILLDRLSQKAIAIQDRDARAEKSEKTDTGDASTSPADSHEQMTVEEQDNMMNLMDDMGFISPVTKKSSGNRYHEELSRQLFDFVQKPVKVYRGNMSLVDVYCLYNRARGSDLVSPQDLFKACQLWSKLFPQSQYPVTVYLKQLKSGSYIVQSSEFNEESERMKIVEFIFQRNGGVDAIRSCADQTGVGVSALEISQHLRVSLQIVQDYLAVLVKEERLVQDNAAHAVLYWFNFFLTSTL